MSLKVEYVKTSLVILENMLINFYISTLQKMYLNITILNIFYFHILKLRSLIAKSQQIFNSSDFFFYNVRSITKVYLNKL